MKNKFFFFLQFLPLILFSQAMEGPKAVLAAEEIDATTFANTIQVEDLKAHLSIIASDEFEGRETGTEGQRKAAQYIEDHFKTLGLPSVVDGNSYQQKIGFSGESWSKIELQVNKKRFRNMWNYFSFPYTNENMENFSTKEILFLGYGIEESNYNDYKGVNVQDKVVMMYLGEPKNAEGVSHITGTQTVSDWDGNWRKKLEVAKKHGAKLVLLIDGEIQKSMSASRQSLLSPKLKIKEHISDTPLYPNNVFISTDVVKAITGKKNSKFLAARDAIIKSGKPKSLKLKCKFGLNQKKRVREILGSNVLGYVEGADEQLKKELVVVTAHYDHLGKKGESIFNGADDNGTGTSTVLELAEAFVQAKKEGQGPRRSVLFMLVSGEEKGLLGSEYYANFPVFPLKNTIANVNVDMIGRVDRYHQDNPNYIYVIGSNRLSTELHEINETANKTYTNIELDYTYNDPKDPNRFYERSDHYNFAERGIPAIFYFSGTHKDYHRPTDTIDKINFEKMEKIGKLIFYTTWELANRDKRIVVDVK